MSLSWVYPSLLSFAIFSVIGVIASWFGLGGAVALVSLLVGALGFSSLIWRKDRISLESVSFTSPPERFGFFALSALSGLSFFFLFYQARGFWWTRNPNNLGDLPMHIQFIRFFERGGTLADSHPLLAGAPFKYPAAMDLLSASLEALGFSTSFHLFIIGAVFTVALFALLKSWSGWWGLVAFVWSGGWSAVQFSGGWGPAGDLAWKNLFLSIWVTQRGFLFALPAGIFLLLTQERHFRNQLRLSKWSGMGLLLLWIGLAFFHLHSFVMVSCLIAFQSLEFRNWSWLKVGSIGLPLALVPVLRSMGEAQGALHWDLNWMAGEKEPIFFWLKNFGFWLMVPIAVLWMDKKNRIANSLLAAFTVLLLNLMLAPWAWDQTKVLIWLFVFWNFLFFHRVLLRFPIWAQIIFTGAVCFPGYHQWVSGLPVHQTPVKLFSVPEVLEMKRLTSNLKVTEAVLTAPTYFHPILSTGQQMWMGYDGHLWSHQLDYGKQKAWLEGVKTADSLSAEFPQNLFAPRWVLFSSHEKATLKSQIEDGTAEWKLETFQNQ